jgi:MoaA/NifB/PqqE/SkfB family radical SAM enzyme
LDMPYLQLGDPALADDCHASSITTAKTVLDRCAEAGITGILVTGGGEPTDWDHLVEALGYSAKLGMENGLYTNGFRLGIEKELANNLLAPPQGLVFVRVSVNAVSPRAFFQHWGRTVELAELQFSGLSALFKARDAHLGAYQLSGRHLPSIQISTIVNHQNVSDLPELCEALAHLIAKNRHIAGPEDVMVLRPMTVHGRVAGYSSHDHDEVAVIRRVIECCGPGSPGALALGAVGVRVFLGFGLDAVASGKAQSYSGLIEREYAQRGAAPAAGLFLTVGQDGSIYPSTEHNCDSDWVIGNLRKESVQEVYRGERRKRVLELLNGRNWGPSVSQPTARTNRLDRIARAVQAAQLDDDMIAAIASVARAAHKLLLD